MNSTRANAAAFLRLISLNNEQMPREINIDVTYGSDLICMWVVYQGPQTEISHLLAPLLQARTSPALVSSVVQQFDCYHELIEYYAQQKHYQQYDSQPYTLKNCLVNATGLALLSSVLPLKNVPDACGISLIHFGGRVGDHSTSYTAFPWRDAQYMLYSSCGWMDTESEASARAWLKALFAHAQRGNICHGAYLNFIDASLENWAQQYYGGNIERLQRVKMLWNPFASSPLHFPQEIPGSSP